MADVFPGWAALFVIGALVFAVIGLVIYERVRSHRTDRDLDEKDDSAAP